jgi:hypothetical protein
MVGEDLRSGFGGKAGNLLKRGDRGYLLSPSKGYTKARVQGWDNLSWQ